uniref:Putative CMB47: carbohydrate-binding protein n=1 Tax=Magnetococcus massalia (strain MO-1) TaxID=451514 RepID=A0A1S7LC38_MAGMO|nr:putative CMB47 : carbohydrate-binding protein [Candidatus Magnetococcus massalia]
MFLQDFSRKFGKMTYMSCFALLCASTVSISTANAAMINLAKGKKATLSSTYPGGDAAKAVDGNRNPSWKAKSIAHSQAQPGAALTIDLGAVYNIRDVHIYNRMDCCKERLNGGFLLVSEKPFPSGDPRKGLSMASFRKNLGHAAKKGPRIVERVNKKGRFVRVMVAPNRKQYLNIAEVMVIGDSKPVGGAGNKPGNAAASSAPSAKEKITTLRRKPVGHIEWANLAKDRPSMGNLVRLSKDKQEVLGVCRTMGVPGTKEFVVGKFAVRYKRCFVPYAGKEHGIMNGTTEILIAK